MSEEQAAAPKPPSKMPMIIIGVVALVLGGAGGFFGAGMLGGGEEAATEAAAEGEGHGEEAAAAEGEGHGEAAPAEGGHGEAAPAEGEGHGGGTAEAKVDPNGSAVVALGAPFTINLRGSGGGRVLRMDVQLEALGKDVDTITARVPAIRDTILIATSDYSWSELEGTDGKTRLRDELLARVNGVTTPLAVNKLYFTQFVVQ